MECPCRYCNKRTPDCHGKCEEYKEWDQNNKFINEKVRQTKRMLYLSREDRPKRRHGRK